MRRVVIGTRGSSLSLCQTQIVQAKLEQHVPSYEFSLKTIKAKADEQPDVPLVAMGGEGIFVKELEAALLRREVDMAVHSMKDLPLEIPSGLTIAAVLERDEPRDAWVSRSGATLDQLPAGSRVGTSSLRRRSQLLRQRSDLQMVEIRGNVDTRLRKLREGQYDAIVVAACGLIRLGLEAQITEYLDLAQMLPEPGQGALAIEARADGGAMVQLAKRLDEPVTRACVEAERAFLRALGGGCRVPIAAYASYEHDTLHLEGAVVAADGHAQVRDSLDGPMTQAVALGEQLAQRLSAQGAAALLRN